MTCIHEAHTRQGVFRLSEATTSALLEQGPLPEELLAATTRPVSILWGAADPWEDVVKGRALFASYPMVTEFVELPGERMACGSPGAVGFNGRVHSSTSPLVDMPPSGSTVLPLTGVGAWFKPDCLSQTSPLAGSGRDATLTGMGVSRVLLSSAFTDLFGAALRSTACHAQPTQCHMLSPHGVQGVFQGGKLASSGHPDP